MGFGAEMKDFIAAFQVGSQIRDRRAQQALDVEQESNRSKEAANKAAATQARYDETRAFNQEGRDYTQRKDARDAAIKLDDTLYTRGRNADLDAQSANKAADEAWYKQVEADPEMGYGPDGTPIPPPSQRGAVKEAIPTTPTTGGTVSSSGMEDLEINRGLVADAIDGGLKKLSQEGEIAGIQSVMEGAGAPKPDTVKQVDAIIDPDNKMSEDQKTLARLEATYEFYLTKYKGKDGYDRANEAAAQWLQHARGVAAIQATAALALNEQGDMVGAAKKLSEMHQSIPDGQSTTYDEASNTFRVTDDETGEVVQEGEVTPELIDEIATSFTKGPAFFNIMVQAASRSKNFKPGEGDAKKEKPITSKELKSSDTPIDPGDPDEINAAMFETISKEVVDIDGAPIWANPEEFVAQVGEDSANALTGLAGMIIANNPGIDSKAAAKLALVIADPDINVGDPSEQQFDGFKVLPISAENKKAGIDIMVIRTPDGRELELPGNDATTAIRIANHGLWIASKAVVEKNVGMTNERVTNDNAAYNLQRAEDQRLRDEQLKANRAGGRGAPPSSLVLPGRRTGGRGGGG